MDELKERHLRPGRKITDQFIIAAALSVLLASVGGFCVPGGLTIGFFESILGGDHDAAAFHAAWNFTQSIFFGLPNSGIVSAYSVFRLDAASATNGPFYNVNFGVEGSAGAVLVLIAVGVVILLKNHGKAEHTDIWAKADQAAIEKQEAIQ